MVRGLMFGGIFVFFFKQKTAYEMRISDWSSDVCSSDLMSQYVRDARITMIYEGANGVQAMDLVGRKLAQNGGRAVQTFFAVVDGECAAAKDGPLADFATRLEKANGELKAATMWFMQNGMTNPNNVGAGAQDRKSTRLNPVTNAHLVCRLLLE